MKTWQAILATMRFRPLVYFFNIMAMVVFFVGLQVPGLAMREFFNLLTGEETVRVGFLAIVAIMSGSGLVRCLGHYIMVTTHIPFAYSVGALLQKNIFAHILTRPGAAALPDSPREAISRFRGDVDTLRWFPMGVADLMGSLLSSSVALTIMLMINWRITLFAFLPIVVVYTIGQVASRRIETYRKASREATGTVTGFLGEIFGAVQSVKVANAERRVVAHFRQLNEARGRTALRDSLFESFLHSMFGNAIHLGTGVILIMAGSAIREGSFTIGDLALFTYYLGFVTELPSIIGYNIAHYRQAGVSLERMTGLMPGANPEALVEHGPIYEKGDAPPVPFIPKFPADALREFRVTGLTYQYPESENGIEGIDLTVAAGSFTVITGRIGCGKTTLVKVMLGLLQRSAGELYWNGKRIDDPAEFLVPPRSAFTSQSPRLFSESLRDNVLMGLPESAIDVAGAIRSAVMERDMDELEAGFDTMIGPKGVKLSGGQQQRAAGRACLRVTPSYWCSMTCPALSTWKPSKLCGSDYSKTDGRHALSYHIDGRLCAEQTGLSSYAMGASSHKAHSTSCLIRAPKCSGSGAEIRRELEYTCVGADFRGLRLAA